MIGRHASVLLAGAAALALAAGPSRRAEAAVTLTMQQSGSDVIVNGSGTLDLADLQYAGSGSIGLTSSPFDGILTTGVGPLDFYSGIVGPSSFGTLRFAPPTAAVETRSTLRAFPLSWGFPPAILLAFP